MECGPILCEAVRRQNTVFFCRLSLDHNVDTGWWCVCVCGWWEGVCVCTTAPFLLSLTGSSYTSAAPPLSSLPPPRPTDPQVWGRRALSPANYPYRFGMRWRDVLERKWQLFCAALQNCHGALPAMCDRHRGFLTETLPRCFSLHLDDCRLKIDKRATSLWINDWRAPFFSLWRYRRWMLGQAIDRKCSESTSLELKSSNIQLTV